MEQSDLDGRSAEGAGPEEDEDDEVVVVGCKIINPISTQPSMQYSILIEHGKSNSTCSSSDSIINQPLIVRRRTSPRKNKTGCGNSCNRNKTLEEKKKSVSDHLSNGIIEPVNKELDRTTMQNDPHQTFHNQKSKSTTGAVDHGTDDSRALEVEDADFIVETVTTSTQTDEADFCEALKKYGVESVGLELSADLTTDTILVNNSFGSQTETTSREELIPPNTRPSCTSTVNNFESPDAFDCVPIIAANAQHGIEVVTIDDSIDIPMTHEEEYEKECLIDTALCCMVIEETESIDFEEATFQVDVQENGDAPKNKAQLDPAISESQDSFEKNIADQDIQFRPGTLNEENLVPQSESGECRSTPNEDISFEEEYHRIVPSLDLLSVSETAVVLSDNPINANLAAGIDYNKTISSDDDLCSISELANFANCQWTFPNIEDTPFDIDKNLDVLLSKKKDQTLHENSVSNVATEATKKSTQPIQKEIEERMEDSGEYESVQRIIIKIYKCNICLRHDFTSEKQFRRHFTDQHKIPKQFMCSIESCSSEDELDTEQNDVDRYEKLFGGPVPGRVYLSQNHKKDEESEWEDVSDSHTDSEDSINQDCSTSKDDESDNDPDFLIGRRPRKKYKTACKSQQQPKKPTECSSSEPLAKRRLRQRRSTRAK